MAEVPQIDGYADLVQVAKGGFGIVYRARQDRHDRVVALKVLTTDDLDDRARQRFERECKAMGKLSWHPNVVALHDSGMTSDGHPYLVMEYLDGGSLGDRLGEGPVPWQEAVAAGVQVAGALDVAHRSGILHRDLKPENLLVGHYGEVKLGDFGIAAVAGGPRTTTGHASFTAHHVAPEILKGDDADECADVYGLASTLHTLISGKPPFAGPPGEPTANVIARLLHVPPPRLGDAPDDLVTLVVGALAKDRGTRPQSASEFGRRLQGIQARLGHPVTELRLAPTSPRGNAPETGDSPQPQPGDARATLPPGSSTQDRSHVPSAVQHGPAPSLAHGPAGRTSGDEPPAGPLTTDREESRSGSSHIRRWIVVGVACLLVAALGVGFLVKPRSSPQDAPASTAVTDSIDVGSRPRAVAATGNAIWITTKDGLIRLDPVTNRTVATVPVSGAPAGVAATHDAVWVVQFSSGTVSRIDPATNRVIATIGVGSFPAGVAATEDTVWVASDSTNTVARIDPGTNTVTDRIHVGHGPNEVVASRQSVWVTNLLDSTVSRIDPITNRTVATIEVGRRPEGISANTRAVWVTNNRDSTLTRIDPATNQATDTVQVGASPQGIASTNTTVWVANSGDGTITRIDPTTGDVTATIPVGDEPREVAATNTTVWITNRDNGTVTRIDLGAG